MRERKLWASGVAHWSDYGSPAALSAVDKRSTLTRLPPAMDSALRVALAAASDAYAARDVDRLAALLPAGEHWRLFDAFGADAAYLDIETGDDTVGFADISAIGVLDRHGPHLLLGGRDLCSFPELARGWSMLVTFNGSSFDLPILRRAFPEWQAPLAHVDLRHVLGRLGHGGGLKAIERELTALHLARPAHLAGIGGWDACGLFRQGREGDHGALRRFAEYNLYDVINLRTLMAYAYNALLEAEARRAPALRRAHGSVALPGRGDVLYDVSKILLAL